MKAEVINKKKYRCYREFIITMINSVIQYYTKVFVTLFGDEMIIRHRKNNINLPSKDELSEHMKRDLGLD
ncbi:hypothetical protein QTO01_07385 [Vibrio mytili]|uniref:hypothetical protein n=1 Tax=Vibrio mytili TaxID=50718 RepID=UPI002F42A87A